MDTDKILDQLAQLHRLTSTVKNISFWDAHYKSFTPQVLAIAMRNKHVTSKYLLENIAIYFKDDM